MTPDELFADAFAQLAATPEPSWGVVTRGARRIRVVRVAAVSIVTLAVVLGAGAAYGATRGASNTPNVAIEPPASTTTSEPTGTSTTSAASTSTTTTTTTTTGKPAQPQTALGPEQTAPNTAPPEAATSVPPTTAAEVAEPSRGNLRMTMALAGPATLAVGETTTLTGTITNISNERVTTARYFSVGAGCAPAAQPLLFGGGQDDTPIVVLDPGGSQNYTIQYTPTADDIGTVYCAIDIKFHGVLDTAIPGRIELTVTAS